MQVQINTDKNIEGREKLGAHLTGIVENALSTLSSRITRLEVHVSDASAEKSGQKDMRCMIEARLEGRQPVAVTHQAASLDEAVTGASGKLARSLETTLGRQQTQNRGGVRNRA